MILEREGWEEAGCCFRPDTAVSEIHPGEGHYRIMEAIDEYDRLIAMDAAGEAAAHLERCLAQFEEQGDWGAQITILNEMMGFYRNQGNRELGLAAVEKGLALVREHRLADTVSGGTTYLNAATTMKAFGRARESLPYYEQAMYAYENSLDPADYRFGGLFNNMALAYEDLEEYKKAQAYYGKAMDIMEQLRPGSILEIGVTWVNLAVLYEKWGHEEEIDGCLQKAMECFHSDEVIRDGYYAFNCRKCADTFGHFGYFRMKRELSEAAETIYGEIRRQQETLEEEMEALS